MAELEPGVGEMSDRVVGIAGDPVAIGGRRQSDPPGTVAIAIGDTRYVAHVTALADGRRLLELNDRRRIVCSVSECADGFWVTANGRTAFVPRAEARKRAAQHSAGLEAPMPGKVLEICVTPGDTVESGDVLLVIEAMKMEQPIRAPYAGVVKAVSTEEGQRVNPGTPLVVLEPI